MIKKIHFIGIKGVGMTALALLAKEKGHEVSGSDIDESFVTDKTLAKADIKVNSFDSQNISNKLDLVVVSAAYGKDNIEVKEAKKKHLEIMSYSEALAFFARDSQVIAVAGIHGKTTTAAMISFLLTRANLDPSFIIGAGEVRSLGTTGHAGKGDYFVVEADEYRKSPEDSSSKFFDLSPAIEIITSIEMDHPDIFASEEAVFNVFYKFACRLPRKGFIVLCTDYPKAKKLQRSLADRHIESYGFSPALWQISNYQENDEGTIFSLKHQEEIIGPFKLKVPGQANILNATAAIITCLKIGLEEKLIKKNLADFVGVKRRFELIGQIGNTVIIDDYAHHPHSISLTLAAARKKFPSHKIWCIFQPHTYSRTKELLKDFATAFKTADKVIITEIYASQRETEATISGQQLAEAIHQNQRNVRFISDWSKIIREIVDLADGQNLIITMGAGDIYKLGYSLLAALKKP
jgi:UDP-N-acetylmuramate--alanine ligase